MFLLELFTAFLHNLSVASQPERLKIPQRINNANIATCFFVVVFFPYLSKYIFFFPLGWAGLSPSESHTFRRPREAPWPIFCFCLFFLLCEFAFEKKNNSELLLGRQNKQIRLQNGSLREITTTKSGARVSMVRLPTLKWVPMKSLLVIFSFQSHFTFNQTLSHFPAQSVSWLAGLVSLSL